MSRCVIQKLTMPEKMVQPEKIILAAEVETAEIALKKNDEHGFIQALRTAGKWAFDQASETGKDIAAEALKRAIWSGGGA